MGDGAKIKDVFPDVTKFDELLETAGNKIKGDWETEFHTSITERYTKYGVDSYLSKKQLDKLTSIAEREN